MNTAKNHIHIAKQLGELSLNIQVSFGCELIIISGDNGSGKTSLLRCLAGLDTPQGNIQIDHTLWLDSETSFTRPVADRKIGFVWAESVVLPWLTVQENIQLGIGSHAKDWFKEVCETLVVDHLLQRQPMTLSTGELQRLALARAVYRQPKLLLLDEPLSAQAMTIRQTLRTALQQLQQQLHIPVLMVSHDPIDAQVLAAQHWHMHAGQLYHNKVNQHESTHSL